MQTIMESKTQLNDAWVSAFNAYSTLQSDNLASLRKAAIDKLKVTRFPNRRDEDWRYSDFTRALNQGFSSEAISPLQNFERSKFEIKNLDGYVLVTVNGKYEPTFSDTIPNLHVSSLQDAAEENWIKKDLDALTGENSNAFTLVNTAFAEAGLVLKCSKNSKIDKPINVIHIATRRERPSMVNTQVFVYAEQSAEITIDETFVTIGEGEPVFRNNLVRGGAKENGRIAYRSIQNEAAQDFHHSNTHFWQERSSFIDHVRIDLGGLQVRNNLDVTHLDENVETHFAGLYFAQNKQRIDNQTFLDHAFPHGESNEIYKGIIMDSATTSFNGKVIVRQDAQKTNAYQQNDNLIIGDKAVANAKPQLEIFADDVKCSHGATIGKMDEGPLFYLLSRGITKGQAISMLQRGFLLEVLERVKSEAIREHVENLLEQKFVSI